MEEIAESPYRKSPTKSSQPTSMRHREGIYERYKTPADVSLHASLKTKKHKSTEYKNAM